LRIVATTTRGEIWLRVAMFRQTITKEKQIKEMAWNVIS
jgi:hypothetical protein